MASASTSPSAATVKRLIDEAWRLAQLRSIQACRPLFDAVDVAVHARDIASLGSIRTAAEQLLDQIPEFGGSVGVFTDVLKLATHWESTFAATGLAPWDPCRLDVRLESLLALLSHRRDEMAHAEHALSSFGVPRKEGRTAIDLRRPYGQWRHLLEGAFSRGYGLYGEVSHSGIRDAQQQIQQQVKAVAVSLIMAGAPVAGLSEDAVPMTAFCLLDGEIPIGMEAAESPMSQDRMNDAVLAIADDLAAMPETSRAPFLDLFRLSAMLGVAQRYAEEVSLTTIATD